MISTGSEYWSDLEGLERAANAKTVTLPIPASFSVSVVNMMLQCGREANFGPAVGIFYNGEFDWGIVFLGGDTVICKP